MPRKFLVIGCLLLSSITAVPATASELSYDFYGTSKWGGKDMSAVFAFNPSVIQTDAYGQFYSLASDPLGGQAGYLKYAYITAYGNLLSFDWEYKGYYPQNITILFTPGFLRGVIPTTTTPWPGDWFDFANITSATFSNADLTYAGDKDGTPVSGTVTGVNLTYWPGGPYAPTVQMLAFPARGLPEPSTWGMMLVGFGAAGASLRLARRRNRDMRDTCPSRIDTA